MNSRRRGQRLSRRTPPASPPQLPLRHPSRQARPLNPASSARLPWLLVLCSAAAAACCAVAGLSRRGWPRSGVTAAGRGSMKGRCRVPLHSLVTGPCGASVVFLGGGSCHAGHSRTRLDRQTVQDRPTTPQATTAPTSPGTSDCQPALAGLVSPRMGGRRCLRPCRRPRSRRFLRGHRACGC